MGFSSISAILLAAGESRRMGRPKLLLPWGETTVLGQVVSTLSRAGIPEILVVTGGSRQPVEELSALLAGEYPLHTIHNPEYRSGGMLSSLKAGIRALPPQAGAALVVLGDQPQIRQETVERICRVHLEKGAALVIPSFHNRRGHPWLVDRSLWEAFLSLPPAATPRSFLNEYSSVVEYVPADESILQDLDTPQEYDRLKP